MIKVLYIQNNSLKSYKLSTEGTFKGMFPLSLVFLLSLLSRYLDFSVFDKFTNVKIPDVIKYWKSKGTLSIVSLEF